MTIVAGFLCTDGIVIASDTQESGMLKSEVDKINLRRTPSWIGAVLGAGDGDYVDMCAQKILRHFAPTDETPVPTMDAIEDYALELFDRHFAPLSVYREQERPVAHMLIAVQPKEGLGQLATWNGTAFVLRHPCAFVGIGKPMAANIEQKVKHAALKWQPMRQVAGVAIYILGEVKATIDGCGGKTDIYMLGEDGHAYFIPPKLVQEREQKYKDMDWREMTEFANTIMLDCAEADLHR